MGHDLRHALRSSTLNRLNALNRALFTSLFLATFAIVLAAPSAVRAQPLPVPSCADPTAFALSPAPMAPPTSAWACLTGSWMDRWTPGWAQYDQMSLSVKAGGLYGKTFKSKIVGHLAAGGEARLFQWIRHWTDVDPVIHETADAAGFGEIRLFAAAQVFDTTAYKLKLKGFRIRATVMLRTTLPSDSAVGGVSRYPIFSYHRVMGPRTRDHRYGILELLGLSAAADWKDRLALQLHWTPLVWGIVGGDNDRFLTHLHLVLSGRPSKYLDIAGELFGLWAYQQPWGTARVQAEGFGLSFTGLFGRWSAQLHIRMSMDDSLETYGFLTIGAGAAVRFP